MNKPEFRIDLALLALILTGYFVVAGLYALRTPAWQTPDEPAHYNYIAQIAQDGIIPVIEPGDWDSAYLEQLKSSRFDPALLDDLDTVQYEDHQPPLYYLLAAPVFSVTNGDLTALRLFSVLIGAVIVVCAYAVGVTMYPDRPQIGLGAAAFVAFLPQHVAILASVNNDALAWAIVAVTLLFTVRYTLGRDVHPALLGVLVGIGLITKATTYLMAGVVALAILLRWWGERPTDARLAWGALIRAGMTYALPALLFGLLWWGRNMDVYGVPDFLGLAAHDAVVVGQPRTAERVEALGFGGYVREMVSTTFNSFFGVFGWMALAINRMNLILGLLLFAWAGLLVDWIRRPHEPRPFPRFAVWVLLWVLSILAVLAFLYYNAEFQQYQGRYMYPLLIPMGLSLALGVDGWRRVVFADRPPTLWLTPLAFLPMAVWSVWLLWRVVVPNL